MKNPANAGGIGLIPGLGISPRDGNGNLGNCILAWEIPWTKEPGGLQSVGSQRVRHNLGLNNNKMHGKEKKL